MTEPQVTLTPGGLCFQPRGEEQLRATLTLQSSDDNILLYKLRTSAPTNYMVSPNSGRLLPHEKRSILIRAQSAKIGEDRFQMEIRYVSPQEEKILSAEKEEKEEIAKMWKAIPASVPRPVQYLLHTFEKDFEKCPPTGQRKDSGGGGGGGSGAAAGGATPAVRPPASASSAGDRQRRELAKINEKVEALTREQALLSKTNSTLEELERANEPDKKKTDKLPRVPPLSVPLTLAFFHFLFAVVAGHVVFLAASSLSESEELPAPLKAYVATLVALVGQ
eukprot:Rhum_TRINITY_DN14345_c14_g1::Rhum_TRINITY_DN14345_c14_g1_i1::g.84732::m.84732